jgi:glycosyltransferase involved in cell wall biosynthesis
VIYVCIPTHNEAATVGVLLWKIRKVLYEFDRPWTAVVHDDASTDDTLEVLERYKRALPLAIIRSEHPIGYGRSVEALLRYAQEHAPYPKRDCAVVLQADFTEDPQEVVSLVKVLEGGADIVAGSVVASAAPVPSGVRMARRFAGAVFRRMVAGAPVSDPLAGFRAYRVIVLKKALRDRPEPLVTTDGWAANVQVLAKLAPHARRISEVPLEPRYDLQVRPSRFRPFHTLLSLARLRGVRWPVASAETA